MGGHYRGVLLCISTCFQPSSPLVDEYRYCAHYPPLLPVLAIVLFLSRNSVLHVFCKVITNIPSTDTSILIDCYHSSLHWQWFFFCDVSVAPVESQLAVNLLTNPDPPSVYPGDSIKWMCIVTSGEPIDISVLYWNKKDFDNVNGDDNSHIEIATNLVVASPFPERRYNASVEEKEEGGRFKVQFSLGIKGKSVVSHCTT